jgi:Flp pilus assembly protein TadD
MRPSRLLPLVALYALFVAMSAPAAELDEIEDLFNKGNTAEALEQVEAVIEARPDDANARFLKGVILTEQNRPEEAIGVFTALTQDHPELAEPYNNLAVLYAARGDYEGARAALETAIRNNPGYATAYENLGDIYLRLATQAYGKAAELNQSSGSAQSKLENLKQIF